MIAYIYKKSDFVITSIVKDVMTINENDVIGKSDYAKGNDFNLLGIACYEEPIFKNEDGKDVEYNVGDIININSGINQSQKVKILSRLEELDKIVTRPQENYIKFLMDNHGYIPYKNELDAINEKTALRTQLSELGW